ncbi:MAG: hypothetical protein AABZ39_15665 [Spirochaetota bacterium]
MKSKKIMIVLAGIAAMIIAGCSSYQKDLLPSIKSVALLSVTVGTDIHRPDLPKPNSGGITLINLGKTENFDMKAVANNLKDIMRSPEARFPFQLAPEDIVFSAKSVKDTLKPMMVSFAPFVEAEGYSRVQEDSGDVPNAVKDLPPTIDGVGFVHAKYSILKKTQEFLFDNGTASVAVEVTVYVKSRANKGVVAKSARVESGPLLKFEAKSRIDTSNFVDVCKDINAKAIAEIMKTISE